jgi:hypothetical protein
MNYKRLIYAESKDEAIRFIDGLKSEIIEGQVENPILLQGLMNTLKKGIDEALRFNAENLNIGGKYEAYGYMFAQKEAGVKYDFSNCNYSKYNDLMDQKRAIEEEIKKMETFLKSISEAFEIINNETGEVEQIYPPIRKSTTIIEIR